MPLARAPGHPEIIVGRGTDLIQFYKSENKFLISKAINKILCYAYSALYAKQQAAESLASDRRRQIPYV